MGFSFWRMLAATRVGFVRKPMDFVFCSPNAIHFDLWLRLSIALLCPQAYFAIFAMTFASVFGFDFRSYRCVPRSTVQFSRWHFLDRRSVFGLVSPKPCRHSVHGKVTLAAARVREIGQLGCYKCRMAVKRLCQVQGLGCTRLRTSMFLFADVAGWETDTCLKL